MRGITFWYIVFFSILTTNFSLVFPTSEDNTPRYVIVGPTNSTSGGFVLPFVNVGTGPWGIAVNPVTNKIYVTCTGSDYPYGRLPPNAIAVPLPIPGKVFVIDGNNQNVVTSITVGMNPRNIVVNPVTNMIYVTNENYKSVSVIDGQTNNVVKTISVRSQPEGLGLDTVSNKIYVANIEDNSISVIDGVTNGVVDTIHLENISPLQVTVNENTNKVYVTDGTNDTVIVIDGSTDKILESIQARLSTQFIAVNKVTNKIYVSGPSATLAVIDGSDNKVINTIKIGEDSTSIAVNDIANKVYVTNRDSNSILVIDGSTDSYLQQLGPANTDYGIAVNPNTGKIYTSSYGSASVWITDDPSSHTSNSVYMSPLKQVQSGILSKDVKCKQNLILVIKTENSSPACVKQTSVTRLLAHGWVLTNS
ncbi:hypothetical protein DYY66_2476 [Candidatus Nitrosotalea sp. FS]|uniref:YncE family protein n=1 Tax=Candidatus Nitrosotalea sp. FS TaxID=2341021 RepID=UPI001408104F|nr:YncE family protein [Candidatus Nitrosotalea sp. FS]NHH97197.1 hypothetical protein [Candidatus Nitrosotalea sp. FS]